MSTIVTGEGVLLDTRPASVASRLLGALIDVVVLFAVVLLGVIALGAVVDASPWGDLGPIAVTLFLATIMIGIPTAVDTLTRGRTLGRWAVGIRVVRDDGGPIVFRQAFVRALTGVFELWLTLGTVAVITSMVHPQGKRVGDILAGTLAVRVRGGAADRRVPVTMPPHLGAWAASADVARLPDGLALSVRQFLGRAAMLHPASRVQLGSQLTAEVQQYVRPLPPAGVHPEAFLAAVLAERRERELAAGLRSRERDEREADLLTRLPHGVPDPVR